MKEDDRYRKGPDAAQRFDQTMARVLTVSKEELSRRETAYQESREDKPRPGPRRKSSR